jgi:hypothetical protein
MSIAASNAVWKDDSDKADAVILVVRKEQMLTTDDDVAVNE